MSLKIVIDMNLSPEWIDVFNTYGLRSVHWSSIGSASAPDTEIMAWGLSNQHIIFTHDLDFGTMLALTHAAGPSIIQIRGQNVLPEHMGPFMTAALQQYTEELLAGALMVIDERKTRVRFLPL